VASAFVELETVECVAQRLGVTPHTIRGHLKQIYEKTGTRRRTRLVSLLCRGLETLRVPHATTGDEALEKLAQ
jgi:DNA-binding NarL/FixJ family response regulator